MSLNDEKMNAMAVVLLEHFSDHAEPSVQISALETLERLSATTQSAIDIGLLNKLLGCYESVLDSDGIQPKIVSTLETILQNHPDLIPKTKEMICERGLQNRSEFIKALNNGKESGDTALLAQATNKLNAQMAAGQR